MKKTLSEELESLDSAFSSVLHFASFSVWKPETHFEKGIFIISIDVDVGCKDVGVRNQGRNDANVHRNLSECEIGEIEDAALPLFVEMFEALVVPATFAVRGQYLDVETKLVERIDDSTVKHDIGAHGYSHREFGNLTYAEAEAELDMTSIAMKRVGIVPRSFIFPRNSVAYLDLLEKYGYKSYRCNGGFSHDRMRISRQGKLYNIFPSIHLARSVQPLLLKKIVDISVAKRAPFHVWFHIWDFGQKSESIRRNIERVLLPLLGYAKEKANLGLLAFETMLSTVEKIEKSRMEQRTENSRSDAKA